MPQKGGAGRGDNRPAALIVETGLFAAAAWSWWSPRRALPNARAVGAWLLGMTLMAVASFYIPTPPSPSLMALTGLLVYAAAAALARWAER